MDSDVPVAQQDRAQDS